MSLFFRLSIFALRYPDREMSEYAVLYIMSAVAGFKVTLRCSTKAEEFVMVLVMRGDG